MHRLVKHFFAIPNEEIYIRKQASNEGFDRIDDFPTTAYDEFFPMVVEKSRVYVELKLSANHSLAALKQNQIFYDYLKAQRIYLFVHQFASLKLSAIGFLLGKNPDMTLRSQAEHRIKTHILLSGDVTCAQDIPPFEIYRDQVFYYHSPTKTPYKTDALVIKCETKDANQLRSILMSTLMDRHVTGQFVPYRLQGPNSKDIYMAQIVEQNIFIDNCAKVTMHGIHRTILKGDAPAEFPDEASLQDLIMSAKSATITDEDGKPRPLFYSIEETLRTEDWGKYFFVCREELRDEAIEYLDDQFQTLYATCPKIFPTPTPFADYPAPQRSQQQPQPSHFLQFLADSSKAMQSSSAAAAAGQQHHPTKRTRCEQVQVDMSLFDPSLEGDFPTLPAVPRSQPGPPNAWSSRNEYTKPSAKRTSSTTTDMDTLASCESTTDITSATRLDQDKMYAEMLSKIATTDALIQQNRTLADAFAADINERFTRQATISASHSNQLNSIVEGQGKLEGTVASSIGSMSARLDAMVEYNNTMQNQLLAANQAMQKKLDQITSWTNVKTPPRQNRYRQQHDVTADMDLRQDTRDSNKRRFGSPAIRHSIKRPAQKTPSPQRNNNRTNETTSPNHNHFSPLAEDNDKGETMLLGNDTGDDIVEYDDESEHEQVSDVVMAMSELQQNTATADDDTQYDSTPLDHDSPADTSDDEQTPSTGRGRDLFGEGRTTPPTHPLRGTSQAELANEVQQQGRPSRNQ